MRAWKRLGIAGIVMVLASGCGAMERATRAQEARQLAWAGPGPGPCLFGGVTEAADAHCAMVTFGVEGELQALNERVMARLGPEANCMDHVDALKARLARRKDLKTERVFSCPLDARAQNQCHVSLAVTDKAGERYVIDNGAVITPATGYAGVASFAAFSREVDGVYWMSFPPSARDVAKAYGEDAGAAIAARP